MSKNRRSYRPSTPRSEWTSSPKTVIQYLAKLTPDDRRGLLRQYDRMSQGGYGGQIEAWSFDTVRSAIYPNWADEDFKLVVEAFKKHAGLDIPSINQLEG